MIARLAKHYLFISMLAFFSIGCASQALRVTSTPEGADVFIVGNDRQAQKVGKTPMELAAKDSPQLFSDVMQVQVVKDGYNPQMVLVPRLATTGGSGRVSFNLEDTMLPKFCQAQEGSFNEVARGVAEASSFIQKKRLPEAASLLQTLSTKYSTVSVLYDLQGNVFFLQKDLTRALEAYKKSNQLSPNNIQTLNMIGRIQQLQGLSSGGG